MKAHILPLLIALFLLAGCGDNSMRTTASTPDPAIEQPPDPEPEGVIIVVPPDDALLAPSPAATTEPSPTATTEPSPTATTVDPMAVTAGDWANMDQTQRQELATYWLNFWKEAGNDTSLSDIEMNVCITEEIIKPDTPSTMLIMAISGRCIQ